jgi:hypothetical protein
LIERWPRRAVADIGRGIVGDSSPFNFQEVRDGQRDGAIGYRRILESGGQ